MQIVNNFFGKTAVEKVKNIPLSDTTIARRCILVAKNLKEQLLEKLRDCTCFEFSVFCDPVGIYTRWSMFGFTY